MLPESLLMLAHAELERIVPVLLAMGPFQQVIPHQALPPKVLQTGDIVLVRREEMDHGLPDLVRHRCLHHAALGRNVPRDFLHIDHHGQRAALSCTVRHHHRRGIRFRFFQNFVMNNPFPLFRHRRIGLDMPIPVVPDLAHGDGQTTFHHLVDPRNVVLVDVRHHQHVDYTALGRNRPQLRRQILLVGIHITAIDQEIMARCMLHQDAVAIQGGK